MADTQKLPRELVPAPASATGPKYENLSVFKDELPDPHKQLYIQLGKDLDKFCLFPKLPAELRVRIWCLMFPRARHVCWDTGYGITVDTFKQFYGVPEDHPFPIGSRMLESHRNQIKRSLNLPITLCISQESRTDTLRHYGVVFQCDIQGFKQDQPQVHDMPFCIDPSHESLWIKYPLGDVEEKGWNNQWLEHLDGKLPGGLASIRCLQVFEIRLRETLDFGSIWGNKASNGRSGLEWFHGLKKITLSAPVCPQHQNECKQRVEDWFQQYQGRVPECHIPETIIQPTYIPSPDFWALQ
ncbi:hypothetical protein BDZ45DRAFT_722734 [Acephala macrosclerotiorum]|nr:hypothetical protein BDZ45DRAFT_722734 [Acephala macrosclerotiorum]